MEEDFSAAKYYVPSIAGPPARKVTDPFCSSQSAADTVLTSSNSRNFLHSHSFFSLLLQSHFGYNQTYSRALISLYSYIVHSGYAQQQLYH